MGKYRYKSKTHRRGGTHALDTNDKVTNWGGRILDKKCLHHLKVGDSVRIRFVWRENYKGEWIDLWQNRYVTITKVLSRTHFIGFIEDPYINEERTSCNICNEHILASELYSCNGVVHNRCNYHVHEKCMKNKKCC